MPKPSPAEPNRFADPKEPTDGSLVDAAKEAAQVFKSPSPDSELKEPPNPKAFAAKKAAFSGDGQSAERMQREFPDLILREPTADERAQITQVLDEITESMGAGMPRIVGVSVRDGGQSRFAGKAVTRDGEHHIILAKELFDNKTALLGSLDDKVIRVLAHETGHLVDRDMGNFSDGSDRLYRDGDLHGEIKDFAARDPKALDWYGYALRTARNPQRELFAQS